MNLRKAINCLAFVGAIPFASIVNAQDLPNEAEWRATIERFSQDDDPRLAANKRVLMEAEYAMEASLTHGTVDQMIDRYISPDYIQHDPNIPQGQAGLRQWFKGGAAKVCPRKDKTVPISTVFAEGDLVGIIFGPPGPDPVPGSYRHIGIFRIKDGKLAEHWGGFPKGMAAPAPKCN